ELRAQALAGLQRGLERRAVALARAEAAAEAEATATDATATAAAGGAVVVERRVGDVDAVGAHALRELDELLLQLRSLLRADVGPRERLREVLLAGLAGGGDLRLGVVAQRPKQRAAGRRAAVARRIG